MEGCGICDTCKYDAAHVHLCENGEVFGLMPGPEAYFNGWFGEYMKVNAGEQAKQIFNFKHDSIVLVQGCGPIRQRTGFKLANFETG